MRRALICSLFLALMAVGVVGCRQATPAEEVAEARSKYTATLHGFVIKEAPLMDDLTTETMPGEGETTGGETATPEAPGPIPAPEGAETTEGIEVEDLAPMPGRQDAILDILVRSDTYDQLPGLTLDVSMAAAQGNEKDHWRIWVDTSDMAKGEQRQITHVIEDVSYEEGDGFNVEIRSEVPAAERGEYREFSEGGPG